MYIFNFLYFNVFQCLLLYVNIAHAKQHLIFKYIYLLVGLFIYVLYFKNILCEGNLQKLPGANYVSVVYMTINILYLVS